MSYNLIIEPIELDDILKYHKEKFNSNNHWPNDIRPDDYYERITNSNTKNWIDLFVDKNKYQTIIINDPYHLEWMKKANEISKQTGKFSRLYKDELDDFVKEFYLNETNKQILPADNKIPYFVRTENVSLKYGQHGVGPYYSIKQIMESLVSSVDGHTPIYPDTKEIVLYLIPFNDKINDSNEWRVFVNNNKITAISQQACYSKFKPDHFLETTNITDIINTKNLLETYAKIIVDYFESTIKHKIKLSNSYTYDFSVYYDETTNNLKPYFIEPNSFGKEYAAGSALFHWLLDEDKLYGFSDVPNNDLNESNNLPNIYMRYVV